MGKMTEPVSASDVALWLTLAGVVGLAVLAARLERPPAAASESKSAVDAGAGVQWPFDAPVGGSGHATDDGGHFPVDPAESVETLAALLVAEGEAMRAAAAHGLVLADAVETASAAAAIADAPGSVSSAYAQETLLALALDAGRSTEVRVAALHSLAEHSGYRVQTTLANAALQERNTAVAKAMQAVSTMAIHNQTEARGHNAITGSERGELCF